MNLMHACSEHLVTAQCSSSILEVSRMMRDQHVGAVVVMSNESPHRPVGVVTDRDIVIRAVAFADQKTMVTVDQVMSSNLVFVPVSASIQDAIHLMAEHGIRRLLVKGTNQELRGILTLDDLLPLVSGEMSSLAQAVAKGLLREETKK